MGLIVFGLILPTACGRRTPPRPAKAKPTFSQLKVIQRGDHLRLSWVMQKSVPPQSNAQQFQIEELELDSHCINCQPQLVQSNFLLFPSEHFIISGRQVYFHPIVSKDLKVHIYKVTHQTEDSEDLSNPQVANFIGFVDFPPPPSIQWTWLPPDSLPNLANIPAATIPSQAKEIRLLRLSWKRQQEKIEFYFPSQGEATQRKLYYRVNIYKTQEGTPWPEGPINGRPIAETFYIDYQRQTAHAFLYQMRLVDSRGNESAPSITYTIASKPKT